MRLHIGHLAHAKERMKSWPTLAVASAHSGVRAYEIVSLDSQFADSVPTNAHAFDASAVAG
jgi:hypothetical protein